MPKTRGAEKLSELVRPKPRKMTQAQVAELCGASQQAVSSWMSGRTVPQLQYMLILKRELHIPIEWWGEPAPKAKKVA